MTHPTGAIVSDEELAAFANSNTVLYAISNSHCYGETPFKLHTHPDNSFYYSLVRNEPNFRFTTDLKILMSALHIFPNYWFAHAYLMRNQRRGT